LCRACLLSAGLVLALAGAAYAGGVDFQLLWTADLKTFTESGATLADIDGDGLHETIVAGREELITLDGDGKELWRFRTRRRYMTFPSILQREGALTLIYAADDAGQLTCLDGTGAVVWQADLKGGSTWAAPAVCDIDNDGAFEVVQTDGAGTVWAFDALSGKELWQAAVKGMPVGPAVADITGDGRSETAVVTGDGMAYLLDAAGAVLWEHDLGGSSDTWATSSPVLFGASDGSGRVLAASNEGAVFCFDAQGELRWRRPVRGPVASTISVGDFDLNGRADVFVVTQLGVVYRFDEDGRVIWDIDMQGRCLAAGAIIDLDGDGVLEYGLCTQQGRLLVMDQAGEFVFDYQFDNRTISVTPVFADVTADSPGLEMVITGGESGRTFCFATQAPVGTLSQWAAVRGTEKKPGAWFGLGAASALPMVPSNLAWDRVLTGQPVKFAIANPDGQPLTATAICTRPDGQRVAATSKVLGKHGALLLPIEVVVPGAYQFSWTLADEDGGEVYSASREVHLEPFANDRALAVAAAEALRSASRDALETLPLSAAGLERESARFEHALNDTLPLQDAASANAEAEQRALAKTADLVSEAHRALDMAGAVRTAVAMGPGTSVLVSEGALWENRAVDRQTPARAANPLPVSRRMVPGEHEPMSVMLFNVLDQPLQARVMIEVPEGGPAVTPMRSVPTVTSLAEYSWDALPELDESAVITIPSLEARELWLDVDAAGVEPGTHQVTVRILALNGAGVIDGPASTASVPPPESTVEISLDVLPFDMAPSGSLRLCTWARYDKPAVDNMLAHGGNVFVAPNGAPRFDAQGNLTGVDYDNLDVFIEYARGEDVVLLLNGVPAIPGEVGSDAHQAGLKAYLADLVTYMASNGLDTDHFALYPYDEPGGHGWDAVNRLVSFATAVRAANPNVMVYVDGGGELPMFEAMAPVIDVWCPGITQLADPTPEVEIQRTHGKMLWSYDCGYVYARPTGANVKNINVAGQFRTAALFIFRHGATGMGYWSYNISEDPWGRIKDEYALVYPGRTKPVTSRRWEAVREGIEDYRILTALRERLSAKDGAPLNAEIRTRIQRLLEERLPELIDQSFLEAKLGLGRDVLDGGANDARVNDFRKEMMDCVAELAR
jgi:outer membrane protein assembly factor BamB